MKETLKYFWRLVLLVRDHWRGLAEAFALNVVIGIVSMALPMATKLLIDNAYPARDVGFMIAVVVGVFVLTVSVAWMNAVQGYFGQIVAVRLNSATSLMFFNHLQHLHAPFFDSHQVGEVMSRFGDVRSGLNAVTGAFSTVIMSTVFLVLVPPFLVLLNWKLAVLSVIMVPATTTIATMSSRVVRRYYKQNAEASASLSAYQYEVLSHVRSLKPMAMEHRIYARVAQEAHAVLKYSLRAARVQQGVALANGILRAIGQGVFAWYAWSLILDGELTLGAFIAFTAYLGYLTSPISRLTGLFLSLQQSSVSLGRMFEYLDLPTEQNPASSFRHEPAAHTTPQGDLSFREVCFAYDGRRPALIDVDLTLPRGSMTAIVGPSGSGKSTLLRLVPRLVEPSSGIVTIGGKDVRLFPLADLRRQIAIVWQEPFVMRGTLLENLLLGNPEASRARAEEAIAACELTTLVEQLPKGLDSPTAEWGATLSGGQRQRLSIARALIRDTSILLLDEAMSNIDAETEEAILSNLRTRFTDRTIVLVTHRLAAAARADRVCLIEDARIVGIGSSLELSETSPSYARMLASAERTDRTGRFYTQ
ncbi:MAG: ABC transporter transmembrane domain-containing protein [Gemmatimonadaceae bacterium]|jgi:ABC-type bacteriocin/lantibiotic exporter with double-glycine peptidase domain|nr:ABC transporter transmembrane domain-containing protein [Gemmatimonadaceae bacterium]